MLGISGTELVIILFFGFLIFGPEKLPQMGRTVGRAIRQFREASDAANQKFKEEVYDPFKDAVEPYAEEIKKQSAPLKEDLDAINNTFKETQQMFTDPFKLKDEPTQVAASSANSTQKTQGIKDMVDDMFHDPFDIKKDAKAAEQAIAPEAEATGETPADDASTSDGPQAQPLPDTGGTVKKTFADSLYGLDDDEPAPATEPVSGAAAQKGGE